MLSTIICFYKLFLYDLIIIIINLCKCMSILFYQLGTLPLGFELLSQFSLQSLKKIIKLLLAKNYRISLVPEDNSECVNFIIDHCIPRYYSGKKDFILLENKVGCYVKVIFFIHFISCHCRELRG